MKNILIVDDQLTWQRILKKILEKEGLKVTVANDFNEADSVLKNNSFDLAILDVRLEDDQFYNVEGLAVLDKIKKDYSFIKTIVLTGYPEAIRNITDLESDMIFLKSPEHGLFNKREFIEAIKNLLLINDKG